MMEKDKSTSNKKEKKFSFNASELKKNVLNQGSAYSWPMGLWFVIFFIVPLVHKSAVKKFKLKLVVGFTTISSVGIFVWIYVKGS